jgi:hypothetical protein
MCTAGGKKNNQIEEEQHARPCPFIVHTATDDTLPLKLPETGHFL